MRFLIDVCVGKMVADWLVQKGYDVSKVWERDSEMSDSDVLTWAYQEKHILITMDKDFGRLIFRDRAPHTGIIRLPDVPSQQKLNLLEIVLERYIKELEEGNVVITVKRRKIRVTKTIKNDN